MKKQLLILMIILMAVTGCTQTVTSPDTSTDGILKVHFLDVGQADSIFIQLPNNETMLIDAGNNGDGETIVAYLKTQKVTKIDYLIGTHPHEDHIGGMDTVISNFSIGNVYMPKKSQTTKTFEDVLVAVQEKGLTIKTAKAGVVILNEAGLEIRILSPISSEYEDLNNYSAVIKLTYQNKVFLFTGDAETLVEKQLSNVDADLLKIGHHGSDTSSSSDFIKAVSPQYAIISVGEDNKYGHPNQSVLDTLSINGIEVYRTDELGTIIATSDGNNITIDEVKTGINTNTLPKVEEKSADQEREQEEVYITKTGQKYHKENCSQLSKSKIPILKEACIKQGYTACEKCGG